MLPVSRVNCGVPVTVTASEKVMVIAITPSALKVPSAVVAETADTVGCAPSITRALFAPSELVAPGAANVKVATLPDASTMVPLFKARAVVLA